VAAAKPSDSAPDAPYAPMKPPLTIGIEEEYQIIDPETRELRSYITEILGDEVLVLGEVKPELHQSIVEIGTRSARRPRTRPPSSSGCGGW
jgi:hypothetical protein